MIFQQLVTHDLLKEIPGGAFKSFISIASRMDRNGITEVSRKTIGKETGKSVKAVCNDLEQLEKVKVNGHSLLNIASANKTENVFILNPNFNVLDEIEAITPRNVIAYFTFNFYRKYKERTEQKFNTDAIQRYLINKYTFEKIKGFIDRLIEDYDDVFKTPGYDRPTLFMLFDNRFNHIREGIMELPKKSVMPSQKNKTGVSLNGQHYSSGVRSSGHIEESELEESSLEESNNTKKDDAVNEIKNAPDVLKYFCQEYERKYGEYCDLNFTKDSSKVNNTLLKQYNTETIKKMIDVLIRDYEKHWKKKGFEKPGLFMLYVEKMNWLRDQVLKIVEQDKKEEEEVKRVQKEAEEANKNHEEELNKFMEFLES
ncbi:hypothetical protein SAMN05216353_11754 [Halobacillus alkaliphilus]|uniref:Uncharacterized protein n=1 Tax=Halobacillus alkaliphilus TaxID=396056 RepID=A0A1I2N7U2_9BACI|nr:hypothetical protein [Halobacillus alkaliphilus]SFF98929.1 hypothetical protein SAMN05216353_11754 [Halobacillus alkaliphilus]